MWALPLPGNKPETNDKPERDSSHYNLAAGYSHNKRSEGTLRPPSLHAKTKTSEHGGQIYSKDWLCTCYA